MKVSVFCDILCGQSLSLCLDQRTIFQDERRNERKVSPGNWHTLQLAYMRLLDAARELWHLGYRPLVLYQRNRWMAPRNSHTESKKILFLNSANKAATNSCEPLGGFRVFTSEGELFIVLGLLTVVTGWCQNSGPEEFWVQEHPAVQLPSWLKPQSSQNS